MLEMRPGKPFMDRSDLQRCESRPWHDVKVGRSSIVCRSSEGTGAIDC